MLRDPDNPQSVLAMLEQVRTNARLARNSISGELWEVVNDAWLQVSAMLAKPLGQNQVGEAVNCGTPPRRAGAWGDDRLHAAR